MWERHTGRHNVGRHADSGRYHVGHDDSGWKIGVIVCSAEDSLMSDSDFRF